MFEPIAGAPTEQSPDATAVQARLDAVAEAEVLAAQAFLAQLDALLAIYDVNSRDAYYRAADPRGD